MNDLGQRLARELGSLATDLDAPHVDTPGLLAAGRRERVRRRSVVAGLAAVAVAVVAVLGQTGLPGGHDRAVDPAPAPAGDALARPLTLPWWGADDQLLRVDGAAVEAPSVTRLVHAQGRTLVAQDRDGVEVWSTLVGDSLDPLTVAPLALTGPPVLGADGSTVWVEDHGADGYAVMRESGGSGQGASLPRGRVPLAAGVADDGRVLLDLGGAPYAWDLEASAPTPVRGLASDAEVEAGAPWPLGIATAADGVVVLGRVDQDARFRPSWTLTGDGTGAWSDDGSQLATAAGGRVVVETEAGAVSIDLGEPDLLVLAWESDSEVLVAQYLAEDRAVTGLWRCSSVELRCAVLDPSPPGTDAFVPGGRVLLPGL